MNEMKDIWFNLNQSRKYYRNLTSSLQALRASVSHLIMHIVTNVKQM